MLKIISIRWNMWDITHRPRPRGQKTHTCTTLPASCQLSGNCATPLPSIARTSFGGGGLSLYNKSNTLRQQQQQLTDILAQVPSNICCLLPWYHAWWLVVVVVAEGWWLHRLYAFWSSIFSSAQLSSSTAVMFPASELSGAASH